jgi:Tetratricopeptide repeat
MSVPLFLAGRDLLEFSRDREQHQRARRTAHQDPHPDAIRPDLASSLNNLSASLADLGRPEDALAAIEEAARVYRELAARWPMPTTSWNNRCDLLTGSSTVKAPHPRGNLRRDNGPLSGLPDIAFRPCRTVHDRWAPTALTPAGP